MGAGKFNAGGNPGMYLYPNQQGVEILLVASRYGLMGHLAHTQTL